MLSTFTDLDAVVVAQKPFEVFKLQATNSASKPVDWDTSLFSSAFSIL
jgi:hypothetical protein